MSRLRRAMLLAALVLLVNVVPRLFEDPRMGVRRPPPAQTVPTPRRSVPAAPRQGQPAIGEALREPSHQDPAYLVSPAGPPVDSTGTAFPVREPGWYMTARHVVSRCDRIGILSPRGGVQPATFVALDARADLALLRHPGGADPLPAGRTELRYGQDGYAFGYPGGRYGQVHGVLLGRVRERRSRENFAWQPMIMWSVVGAHPDSLDSLSGMSGGPMLDTSGTVVGVNSSASERRGRLATVAPRDMEALLAENGIERSDARSGPIPGLDAKRYARAGERLRRSGRVVHVLCDVREDDTIRGWR